MGISISVSDVVFHQHIAPKPGGSCFLGFIQKGKLHFQSDDGATCTMDLKLEVRKNREGKLSLAAPGTPTWTNRQGETVYPRAYRFDDHTYAALKQAVAQLPAVQAAWTAAENAVAAPAPQVESLAGLTAGNPALVAELARLLGGGTVAASAPQPAPTAISTSGVRVG